MNTLCQYLLEPIEREWPGTFFFCFFLLPLTFRWQREINESAQFKVKSTRIYRSCCCWTAAYFSVWTQPSTLYCSHKMEDISKASPLRCSDQKMASLSSLKRHTGGRSGPLINFVRQTSATSTTHPRETCFFPSSFWYQIDKTERNWRQLSGEMSKLSWLERLWGKLCVPILPVGNKCRCHCPLLF